MDVNNTEARFSRVDGEVLANESAPLKHGPRLQWTSALPIIVLAAYLAALMVRFAYKGELYLSFFVDDFFYYLVVAKNLAFHGASTFNGVQATNGYHPLWLLTLAFLYRILGTHLPFFVGLMVLIWLLVCGSYVALRRSQISLGIGGDAGLAWALLSVTFMAVLSRTGMEVSLALFCLSLFWARMAKLPLERQTPAEALVSGLLASALVLSRLDTSLVVATYGALTLIRPAGSRRTAAKQMSWFTAGLLPVAIYVAINQMEFGTILPVSGIVKNLKSTWFPSASTVSILALPRLVNIVFTWPSLDAMRTLPAPCASWERRRQCGSSPVQSPACTGPAQSTALRGAPSVHFLRCALVLQRLADVVDLVSLPVGTGLGAVGANLDRTVDTAHAPGDVVARCRGRLRLAGDPAWTAWEPTGRRCLPCNGLSSLREFATAHPGRYGIGDAGGMGSYLMPMPVSAVGRSGG